MDCAAGFGAAAAPRNPMPRNPQGPTSTHGHPRGPEHWHNFREVVASAGSGDHNFPEVVTIWAPAAPDPPRKLAKGSGEPATEG